MVQVLERTAAVMDILAEEGRMALRTLTERTGLQKTTLSNILKTLVAVGYVERQGEGHYGLGPAVVRLAYARLRKVSVRGAAEEQVTGLAQATQEAAVLTMVEGNDVVMVAKAAYDRGVTVNTNMIKKYSPYSTATGRTLLAYMDRPTLDTFVKRTGLPGDTWPEASTMGTLQRELARIRDARIEVKVTGKGEVQALAVPVFGPDGSVWAALGVYLPAERFKGGHKQDVIHHLKQAGDHMSSLLALPPS